MIKSRRLRWAGHVAGMEGKSAFKILTGKPTGKSPLGRTSVDGRTILKWFLKKLVSTWGSGLIQLRVEIESPCECDIEPPGSLSNGVS